MYHPSSYGDPNTAFYHPSAPPTTTTTPQDGCFFEGGHPPAFLASSSPPYSSSSSLPSYYLQRSSSSHSLSLSHPNIPEPNTTPPPFFSSSPPNTHHYHYHHHNYPPPPPPQQQQPSSSPSSSGEFFDFQDGPVRRVFSTGDLQASGDNCNQEGGAIAARVGRYSAEERKERIERYRNKRNQRNFHKKITYACRKTLADSRPRIRGRFARNGEMESEMEAGTEVETEVAETSYDCHSCGNNYDGDLWRQMQAALGTTDEEEGCGYDEDLLASFVDVFSMNLLS